MYIDASKSRGKYIRYLLRESYREKGKVKHRTIANLSKCSQQEIQAIRFALKYKKQIDMLAPLFEQAEVDLSGLFEMVTGGGSRVSTLDAVRHRGFIRAGVRNDLFPFGFIDKKGMHRGFEIDIVKQFARRLGVGHELIPVTSSMRIPLLLGEKVDLIAATMTQCRKRDELVDFSIGYFQSPQTLMVKKGKGIESLSDMAFKYAGACYGSAGGDNFSAVQPRGYLRQYGTHYDAYKALKSDAVDAVVSDSVILESLPYHTGPADDVEILSERICFAGGYYAVAVKENDSRWRDMINGILHDMWKEGAWEKIFNKWFAHRTSIKNRKDIVSFQMSAWQ